MKQMKTKNFLANPNICMLENNGYTRNWVQAFSKRQELHLERLLFIPAVRERTQFSGKKFRLFFRKARTSVTNICLSYALHSREMKFFLCGKKTNISVELNIYQLLGWLSPGINTISLVPRAPRPVSFLSRRLTGNSHFFLDADWSK